MFVLSAGLAGLLRSKERVRAAERCRVAASIRRQLSEHPVEFPEYSTHFGSEGKSAILMVMLVVMTGEST